jgi:hypothetical protein
MFKRKACKITHYDNLNQSRQQQKKELQMYI